MAKFVYRMQNILDIKLKLEEQEKVNFGIAAANYEAEQEKLRQLMIRQGGYERQLKELSVGSLNIREIKTCKNAITSMKVALREQMIQTSKAKKQMDIARSRLNSVMMERKMHEKLKEKDFDKFKEELNRDESRITDELVSYTHFINEE